MAGLKINEVEALVGITKKNIRFYEEQGLLTPKRNAENSYREYGDGEVQTLHGSSCCESWAYPLRKFDRCLTVPTRWPTVCGGI